MHILTNNRPFFSIIVPCYNSRKTLPALLDSVINQHLDYNDIQVILSDDCSTESYQDIVDKYKDKLNIKQVKTDYNCCPGNTRQRGAENATGVWMTFIDHDDFFIDDTFKILKKDMEERSLQSNNIGCYFTRFYKKTLTGQFIKMPPRAGWTHGKFFNLDNFWKKYQVGYVKDMASHEDICMTSQLEYINSTFFPQIICYAMDLFTYVWNENPKSLSNKKYMDKNGIQRPFLDLFFTDYIKSTAETVYSCYLKYNKRNPEYVEKHLKFVMLYSYFYLQWAVYVTPTYLKQNFDQVFKYITILKDQFNCSIEDIYNFYRKIEPNEYKTIHRTALGQTDIFVYQHSFMEWLRLVANKEY